MHKSACLVRSKLCGDDVSTLYSTTLLGEYIQLVTHAARHFLSHVANGVWDLPFAQ